jgi:thioredoxin-like negative regulator of GroEL
MALERLGGVELEALIASGGRVVVEVQAPWCTQCASQALAVERIVPEYDGRVAFGAIDLGDHPELGERFGVTGLPAFIFFQGGKCRSMVGGYRRAAELRALIREHLAA